MAYVNKSNFSKFNYEKRTGLFAELKVEKNKDIAVIRWTGISTFWRHLCRQRTTRELPTCTVLSKILVMKFELRKKGKRDELKVSKQ